MIHSLLDDIRSERTKKVILDTDTFNEIDDQFALAYLLLNNNGRTDLLSVNAAPFFNSNSSSPADGMEKSYQEILKIFRMLKVEHIPAYRGSCRYLSDEKTPEDTDAARNIIHTAHEMPNGERLYIIAIGAITNIASALLLDPTLKDRIAVIWLGGHALHIGSTQEFNMIQDIAAARIVFNCGVPLVMVPCFGMCSALTISVPELETWLRGKNDLCDYLCDNVKHCFEDSFCRSRVIWDVSAVTVLIDPSSLDFVTLPSPVITYDGVYAEDVTRHPILYVRSLNRDAIFEKLFRTLLHAEE